MIKNTKAIDSKASIWIISYTMATNIEQLLKTKSFNMVIVDESHYLKNTLAKRTQKLVPILQRSKRIILLSGTPVLSRPAELFPQVSCIRPDIFNSFRAYAERFCDPKVLFNRTDYSGAAHMRELNIMISSTLMIRRLKSEVLAELPSKIRQKIEIPVSQENCKDIRKSYFDMKKKAKDMANDINSSREGDLFLSNAYKLTALAKLKGVSEYVSYLIQNDCKFIIFGHHMDMLDAIEETVTKEKVKYIRIDGSTNEKKRHQGIEIFQTDKECKVAILGILAAGQGITLTAASTVVMAEMAWTPGVMIQAEDRAHRIGQAKSVNIHYLFGPGTLDEFIWPKVHAKLTVITGALDGTDNIDIRSLLQPECKIGMGDFENEFEIFHRKRKESSDSEEKMAKLNDN